MTVHGKTRYCDKCELHVHDLMAMSSDEVQSLIANADGRLCVRMERDVPRRVPTGWLSTMRSGEQPMWKRIAAAAGLVFVGLWSAVMPGCKEGVAGGLQPAPNDKTTERHAGLMGDACVPLTTQPAVEQDEAKTPGRRIEVLGGMTNPSRKNDSGQPAL